MCLILFAYQVHPVYKLIVAANRDEFYQRPTAAAHFWEDQPEILAGRDLEKMGTWMGVTRTGRFAALTNYRDAKEQTEGKRSRGELVEGALKEPGNVRAFLEQAAKKKNLYPGYNLIAGDVHELYYYSNRGKDIEKLEPGIYGVSNHLLNTDWPKVSLGKEVLLNIVKEDYDLSEENDKDLVNKLMLLLQNEEQAPDKMLPSTGVSLEWERLLSSMFIESGHYGYGTRSSTVLLMSNEQVQYTERVFSNGKMDEQRFVLEL